MRTGILLAFVLSFDVMGSSSITFNPVDLKRGEQATVETSGMPEGTVIYLEWTPAGGQPTSVTVGADGKATFTVPDAAETVVATEPKSGADAAAVVFP